MDGSDSVAMVVLTKQARPMKLFLDIRPNAASSASRRQKAAEYDHMTIKALAWNKQSAFVITIFAANLGVRNQTIPLKKLLSIPQQDL